MLGWNPLVDIHLGSFCAGLGSDSSSLFKFLGNLFEINYETGSKFTFSSLILFPIEFSTIFCFVTERIEI